MKRLLVLTILATLPMMSSGCARSRSAQCRPCVPAPCASPCASPCGGATMDTYSMPGTVISAPTLTVPPSGPVQVIPGPETYAPSTQ